MCILLSTLLQYSRSTNFFWMFNESFYLNRLLHNVFEEQTGLKSYYIIGWSNKFNLKLNCSVIVGTKRGHLINESCKDREA